MVMTENIEISSQQENPQINREEIVEMFRKFSQQGTTHPVDLVESDPAVTEAYGLLDEWATTHESDPDYDFLRSTIFVDAGFHDPDFLEEVRDDWLLQDEERAEGDTELVKRIQAKRDEITGILERLGRDGDDS